MKIKFINAIIVTVNENFDVINDGELEVVNNKISYVGKARKLKNAKTETDEMVIDCKGNTLMPGLINCHSHAAMSLFRGLADDATFEDWWKDNILPREEKLTLSDIKAGVNISANEMLQNGITTFFDCYFMQEGALDACNDIGIRLGIGFGAISGKEVFTLESLEKEYEKYKKHENVIPFLYAHSTYSCDEFQFSLLLQMAKKHNLVFCTHVSETLKEVGECHNKHGVTPIGLLESYGMFDIPCVLAHCVHCDKDDAKLLQNYADNVSINHNPASNLKLGSGIAPVTTFLKNNLNVCLGTDGPASNNSLDILKEMYLAGNLQFGLLNNPKAISAQKLIEMATINGAKAFKINNLGALKKDYLADIIMLNSSSPNMQPNNNVINNIAFSASSKNVILTMVNGKILYNNFC